MESVDLPLEQTLGCEEFKVEPNVTDLQVDLKDFTLKPFLLVKCALTNPRTLWDCQPVTDMMAFSVAPSGRFSSAMIRSVLVPAGCV